jgi:hypothetical protein
MNKKDFLTKFKTKTKTITVKAWEEEVEIRELTVSEHNEVQSYMLKDSDLEAISHGKVEVSIGKLEGAKVKAVSMALVNPKLTEDELSGLGRSAQDGINEIYEAINGFNEPKK